MSCAASCHEHEHVAPPRLPARPQGRDQSVRPRRQARGQRQVAERGAGQRATPRCGRQLRPDPRGGRRAGSAAGRRRPVQHLPPAAQGGIRRAGVLGEHAHVLRVLRAAAAALCVFAWGVWGICEAPRVHVCMRRQAGRSTRACAVAIEGCWHVHGSRWACTAVRRLGMHAWQV